MFNGIDYTATMLRCIDLAKQSPEGVGKPFVGAVVLNSRGEIVGEGRKSFLDGAKVSGCSGLVHAERNAIWNYQSKYGRGGRGETLVTTLEPCIHFAKNILMKSCSEFILDSGMKRVVIGAFDTNPRFTKSFNGHLYLRKKGVEVIFYLDFEQRIKEELLLYK